MCQFCNTRLCNECGENHHEVCEFPNKEGDEVNSRVPIGSSRKRSYDGESDFDDESTSDTERRKETIQRKTDEAMSKIKNSYHLQSSSSSKGKSKVNKR
jgi:hypothetical protein